MNLKAGEIENVSIHPETGGILSFNSKDIDVMDITI
jgi:predicted Rdx family selenoprotein